MTRQNFDFSGEQVLIRDDDAERRLALTSALREVKLSVIETENSAAAIACLEQDSPLLVLAVANSSDVDGLSLCEIISTRTGWDTPPVLVLLDQEDAHLVELTRHAGATDVIMLPCSDAWLRSRVLNHLSLARAAREMRRSVIAHSHAERLAGIGSWEWNTETNQMHWSDETFRVLGRDRDQTEMTHTEFWNCVHPEDRNKVRDQAGEALDEAQSYTIQHRVQLPDGSVRHVQQNGELIVEEGRRGRWLAGSVQDMTQQRLDQERIRYLANYDSLTGLANRRLFGERLDQELESARTDRRRIALLYMDLDRFKRINDTLGHAAGDQLLRHVANILRANTRDDDLIARPKGEKGSAKVARPGGDEFMILLSEMVAAEDAGDVARRILAELLQTVDIFGHQISALGSIGVAVFPEDGADGETLIRNADTAMYHAKECGRNQYKFFDHSMNRAAQRRLLVESRLRVALEREEINVHYQPKLGLANNEIYGMEALARWNDPDLGGISPKEFVSLAEESGQIFALGKYVLETACAETQRILQEHGRRLVVSVNVSSVQFSRENFSDVVAETLRATGLDPKQLELEITESLLLQDDDATGLTMRELKAMGVRMSLDDFGTGYSSLSYLTRFPFDTLKLDRCFVRDIETDPAAAGVASAVISMAHSLGLRVVAEGVDMEAQKNILTEWRCDGLQGFLFCAALAPEEFERFYLEWNVTPDKRADWESDWRLP